MNGKYEDYTGTVGDLGSGQPVEMLSYSRVSSIFWNAFANEMEKQHGALPAESVLVMKSKCTRWMLDGMEGQIERCAARMVKQEGADYLNSARGQ